MIKKLICGSFALGSSLGLLVAADAFTGSWQLDVAKSTFASDYAVPKEVTLTFTERGANRIQIMKRIDADGSATSTEWTAPITGGTVNFPPGQGPNGGASLTVVEGNTLRMTQNLPRGKAGASRTYQVSADGATLTLTVIREDGRERAKMAFNRQ
jgi:hypothetical protein